VILVPSEAGEIVVEQAGQVVQRLPLKPGVITIGRQPENDLVLKDVQVSRHHAELRLEPAEAMLIDLGSSNGTFVGGARLPAHQPYLLADGATWQIGTFVLTYHAAPSRPLPTVGESQQQVAPPPSPEPPVREPALSGDGRHSLPRPTSTMPLAPGPTSRYLHDLPIIFQDDDFLARFLLIFESIWEPLEQRQDHIQMYIDPRTCPATFLSWLAGWLSLSFNPQWPEARRRRLLAEAMALYRSRGTREGMVRMIEVCTGVSPEVTDDPSDPFVFRVSIPRKSAREKELIEELIRMHKPAHAGYVLEVKS
jgi:phage tail-like protein